MSDNFRPLPGAVIGAAVGAVLWAAAAYLPYWVDSDGYRVKDWGVLAVGLGAGLGGRVGRGPWPAVLACAAGATIVGGQVGRVGAAALDGAGKGGSFTPFSWKYTGHPTLRDARAIATARMRRGEVLAWPAGVDPDRARGWDDFPPDVMAEAEAMFKADPDGRQTAAEVAYRREAAWARARTAAADAAARVERQEIAWFVVAVITAALVARHGRGAA